MRLIERAKYDLHRFFGVLGRIDHTVTTARPKLWQVRWLWLEARFYPKRYGTTISQTDKILSIFILLSILVLALEYLTEPATAELLSWTSFLFLAVFGVEFLCRLYLRGWAYFRRWGLIDLPVVISDLIICLTLVYGASFLDNPYFDAAPILRIARLARLFRALKLIVQFSRGQNYYARQFARVRPYFYALFLSILIAISAVMVFVFLAALFFQADVIESLRNVWTTVREGLVGDPLSAGEKSLPEVVEQIENVAALIVILAVTTIVTQIFVAILTNIKRSTADDLAQTANGHVVVYINSDTRIGMVEEIQFLYRRHLRFDTVYVIDPDVDISDIKRSLDGETVLFGTLAEPDIWRRAALLNARLIVVLDDIDLGDRELHSLALSQAEEGVMPNFNIAVYSDQATLSRTSIGGDPNLTLVHIPVKALEHAIEEFSWQKGSHANAALSAMTGFLGLSGELRAKPARPATATQEQMQVPDVVFPDGLAPHFKTIDGRTLYWFDEDASETAEISLLSVLLDHMRSCTPFQRAGMRVSVYVRSFELLEWQRLFDALAEQRIQILALELISVLAAYHETLAPNATQVWLADAPDLTNTIEVSASFLQRRRFGTKAEIQRAYDASGQTAGDIVGVRSAGAPAQLQVFPDNFERLVIYPADHLIVVPTV